MLIRGIALLVLALAPLPLGAQDKKTPTKPPTTGPLEMQTAHWTIRASLPAIPSKDFEQLIEKHYDLWVAKAGPAAGAPDKLQLRLYYEREEFNALPNRTGGFVHKDSELHVFADPAYAASIAMGGPRTYLTAAYPGLMKRTDLPPWVLAGITAYLGTGIWREGHVEIDSLKHPQSNQSFLSFQNVLKSSDWVSFEKGFKFEGREYEIRRRVIDLQAWALVYWLFNAPGEEGGKSPNAAVVPTFLAALNEGKKFEEALAPILKLVPQNNIAGLERAVKEYFGKIKIESKVREEGDWLVGDTAHYTISVQKGALNKKTKQNEKQILDELKWKMELLFEKYALAFKFQGMLPRKAVLKLHKNKASYIGGGAPPSSAAYYNTGSKELVGYEDSEETGIYFNILCHEGCHQFFDLAFPGFYETKEIPMWFSEGLADCFGASEIRGRDIVIFTLGGTAAWRVEAVKQFSQQGQLPAIKDMLNMDQQPFMINAQMMYPQSWSFVHFLWNFPSLDAGKGQYFEIVVRLIDGFKVGKPRAEVYKDAFQVKGKPVDIDQLEREWKAYVKTLKVRK